MTDQERIVKLQQFKDWVHSYLDGKGVPHHPPGPHGHEGCRIGDRMDWVFGRLTIADLIRESHATAVEKGWWEKDRPFSEGIALMHSELSEALEEWRKYGLAYEKYTYMDGGTKPEGIAVELADLLIRVGDWCGKHNIPLEEALRAKMAYNKTRPHRHGGKLA